MEYMFIALYQRGRGEDINLELRIDGEVKFEKITWDSLRDWLHENVRPEDTVVEAEEIPHPDPPTEDMVLVGDRRIRRGPSRPAISIWKDRAFVEMLPLGPRNGKYPGKTMIWLLKKISDIKVWFKFHAKHAFS